MVKHAFIAASMAVALGFKDQIDPRAWRLYLDQILQDAGQPTDPIKIMLLEQAAICHLQSLQLQGEAKLADDTSEAEICHAAAARYTAELRKIALTLKQLDK